MVNILKPRYFNTISIKDNILTKFSEDGKLLDEINWYLSLPNELKYITPELKKYSLKLPYTIELEFYPGKSLHHFYIEENLNIKQWQKIINLLLEYLLVFDQYKIDSNVSDLYDMYITKTIERLNELSKNHFFYSFFDKEFEINNVKYQPLNCLIKQIPIIVKRNQLLEKDYFVLIHGDYCLSNILYSIDKDELKFIDPRGKFGQTDLYGDDRYDIAKLAHCFDGKYDLIISNKFSLSIKKNKIINYHIYDNYINKQIETYFWENVGIYFSVIEIKLIEALLFLSMVPLHADSLEKQVVMFSVGIEKVYQFI